MRFNFSLQVYIIFFFFENNMRVSKQYFYVDTRKPKLIMLTVNNFVVCSYNTVQQKDFDLIVFVSRPHARNLLGQHMLYRCLLCFFSSFIFVNIKCTIIIASLE